MSDATWGRFQSVGSTWARSLNVKARGTMGASRMRQPSILSRYAAIAVSSIAVSSCDQQTATVRPAPEIELGDPIVARALNDPLMIDPDLASRNEANAAITIAFDHALPSITGSEKGAQRARTAARLELLEEGALAQLPQVSAMAGPPSLAQAYAIDAVLRALALPEGCTAGVREDFSLAADLPDHARLMPRGMVRVAAAVDTPRCSMRAVRYATQAGIEDALSYHYNVLERAGFAPGHHEAPERSLMARAGAVEVIVAARAGPGDLTAVDLVTWQVR